MKLENLKCMTPQQAAAYLGISLGLCYRMLKERQIPAVRFGRRLVIPAAALDALLDVKPDGGKMHGKD